MCSAIVAAHHLPYAATASVAWPRDLYAKVRRAVAIDGPTFLQVYSPCPLGWRHESESTIEVARLAVETGFFPLVEIERGQITGVMQIREKKPVIDYLTVQGRFRHLLGDSPEAIEGRAHLQAIADRNIEVYGLLAARPTAVDSRGAAQARRGATIEGVAP